MLTIAYKYKNVFHFPSSPTSTAIWHRKKGKARRKASFPHFLFKIFLYDTDFNEILNTWHSCECVCLCARLSVVNPLNISQDPHRFFPMKIHNSKPLPWSTGWHPSFMTPSIYLHWTRQHQTQSCPFFRPNYFRTFSLRFFGFLLEYSSLSGTCPLFHLDRTLLVVVNKLQAGLRMLDLAWITSPCRNNRHQSRSCWRAV